MPDDFHLFRDHTARLGTRQDLSGLDLVCISDKSDPAAWSFPLSYSAVLLYEALPGAFTFDHLTEEGERLYISSARCVEHLRRWEVFGMIETAGGTITKRAGNRPYF